jgi:selenophosphate synthase
MQIGSACQLAKVEFRVVAEQISTRDLVQEYLANRTYPTSSDWVMPKMKGTKKNMNLFNYLIDSNLKNSSSNLAKNVYK